jgi:hypothetical protein
MIYILCSVVGLVVAGLSMLLHAAHSAPEGFEDEQGFHQFTGSPAARSAAQNSSILGHKALSYK